MVVFPFFPSRTSVVFVEGLRSSGFRGASLLPAHCLLVTETVGEPKKKKEFGVF